MTTLDSTFDRRSPTRRATRVRPAALRARGRVGQAERLERRDLLAITAAGIQQTTPDVFLTDFSEGMTSQYAAYTITNDASGPALDVWVKAVFPAGSVVGCGAGYNQEDGLYRVGTLVPGATDSAYLYYTAKALSGSPVPYALEVYDGDPTGGGALLATKALSFTSVTNTIQANPNEISSVSVAPPNPRVGDTLALTVEGYLGNGANRALFAPATLDTWQPDVFELRGTAIAISRIPQTADGLFFDGLTPIVNQQPFTAVYSFQVTRTTPTPTPVLPTQFTEDGLQSYKHHRLAEAPFPPIPPVLPVLTLTKDDGVSTYLPGGTTTYSVVLANTGLGAATGVSIADALPPQVDAAATTWTVAYTNATGTLPASGFGSIAGLVDLAPLGGTVVITIQAAILASALGDITNTVTATLDGAVLTASDTNTAEPLANLTITKNDFVSTVVAGAATIQTYRLRVKNEGLSDAQDVVVTDTWPAAFVQGAFTMPTQGTVTPSGGGSFTWSVGKLAPGAIAVLRVSYTVPSTASPGPVSNTATASSTTPDSNPANTATDLTTVQAVADLSVTVRDGDGPYVPGTSITYIITASNAGPSTVFGTRVSDPLPAKTTFVSATGGGTYDSLTRTVTFPVGTLGPGGSQAFTLTLLTDPDRRGDLLNTATIAVPGGVTDPDLANNVFTDPAVATPRVALGVTKTDGADIYHPGGTTTYTITVTNSGPSTMLGGTVSDPLPILATGGTWSVNTSGAGTVSTPSSGSGSLAATLDLPPGGTATFTSTVAIRSDAMQNLVNTVTVTPPADTAGNAVSATDVNRVSIVSALVLGTDDGCNLRPFVKIVDPVTGGIIRQFLAYAPSFIGSVRVATGDLDGDGLAEIVTAPGRNLVGEIRVFTQQGLELPQYRTLPFGPSYTGGVEVAVGDVDGDGTNDLVAAKSVNAGLVNVFKVTAGAADPVANVPLRSFRPFPAPYALGVTVAAGDFGTFSGGIRTSPLPDGRAEIVVGTNAGTRALVRIFDASTVAPMLVQTLLPFASTFTGGVTLSAGRFTLDPADDVMIGAGVGGGSLAEVYDGATWAIRKRIDAFASFARPNAAVFAAMLDMDGNGVADDVYGVQGRNATGGTNGVRRWNRLTNTTTSLPASETNAPPLRIAALRLAR